MKTRRLFSALAAGLWLAALAPPVAAQERQRRDMDEQACIAAVKAKFGAGAHVAVGPSPIFDDEETKPFWFFEITSGANGPPGRVPDLVTGAIDTRNGKLYSGDPQGFTAWAQAIGLPGNASKLDADLLFVAWLSLSGGTVPDIARGPSGSQPPDIQKKVFPPRVTPGKDGGITLEGFTSVMRGTRVTHHKVEIARDGTARGVATELQPPQ